MQPYERHAKILERLGHDRRVFTAQLARMFDVSHETVRRDLLEMEQSGSLTRVHGGAVAADREILPEPAFSERRVVHADKKAAIGTLAATLIPPGSTVFIDAGTTTCAFARALAREGEMRIITNSIEIAQLAGPARDCDTLLLGGRPHTDVPATYGEMTLSEIDRFLADYAVLSPVGLHADRGATDYALHEAEVARAMMRRSRDCIMLCHSEKIGTESRVSICRLDEIDHLVTDDAADRSLRLPRGEIHYAETRLDL
ncbi:DeoR/GlpR family DNA-binding transcription regulator [Rhodovulum sulfidophilum]|uniref:DeoR/GlpR family DNA-binding transcription regulator n=1 Tax=Rhodovulum sulfidophilum TaxID=35806 RepID=UPI0009529E08|nr:DeoR/GlpR family DNA-binding transcription regulator [Rhodovulum sulfidophilum]MBL3551802.1 DeoR/GlpR transcriptional regulator [Rhodovulum sulfidophilum]OLS47113.1 DeoR family transcriptional regulator [Rhodovulum sulfidophilum]